MTPRRLVVIGEPAAGKTVMAIQLVRELLRRRDSGQPVAALLPVASWNPRTEHLHRWIAAQLEETYPALRAATGTADTTIALRLVQTGQILPIFDGLDEMATELRACALRSFNRAFTGTQALVMTCRADEYRQTVAPARPACPGPGAPAIEPLAGATVVELRPLRPAEAEVYLRAATPARDVAKWEPVFARMGADPAGPLGQALSTPLMVALARTAYAETTADPGALLDEQLHRRVEIENHLIARLIPTVYTADPRPDRRPPWTSEQAREWLGFLAGQLSRRGTRELSIAALFRRFIPVGPVLIVIVHLSPCSV
jgi:hypothetical protein